MSIIGKFALNLYRYRMILVENNIEYTFLIVLTGQKCRI
jgi:hypothetical protein